MPETSPNTSPDRAAAHEAAGTLLASVEAARARLHARDEQLEQSALVGRAMLGESRAIRELQLLERYERTGGIPQGGRRAGSYGPAAVTCGSCGSFIRGDGICNVCGHRDMGDARGVFRHGGRRWNGRGGR